MRGGGGSLTPQAVRESGARAALRPRLVLRLNPWPGEGNVRWIRSRSCRPGSGHAGAVAERVALGGRTEPAQGRCSIRPRSSLDAAVCGHGSTGVGRYAPSPRPLGGWRQVGGRWWNTSAVRWSAPAVGSPCQPRIQQLCPLLLGRCAAQARRRCWGHIVRGDPKNSACPDPHTFWT